MMNVMTTHTCVMLMLFVRTQRDHIIVPVTMDMKEMDITAQVNDFDDLFFPIVIFT